MDIATSLSMGTRELDAFIDDCFLEQDPLCDLRQEDSIVLDKYLSKLISDQLDKK